MPKFNKNHGERRSQPSSRRSLMKRITLAATLWLLPALLCAQDISGIWSWLPEQTRTHVLLT